MQEHCGKPCKRVWCPHARAEWARGVSHDYPEMWEKPDPSFEAFVCEMVRHRIGKYVQPDHPNRVSLEDAERLYR